MRTRSIISSPVRTATALAVALAIVCPAATVYSQALMPLPVPPVNLQRWRPAPNPGDYLTAFGSMVDNHLRLTGGLYFNYAKDPLSMTLDIGADKQAVIEYQLFADLMVSLALFEWVEIAAVMPVGLVSGSENRGLPFARDFTGTGLSDLRVLAKSRILLLSDAPVGVGAIAGVTLPTGDTGAFYGDDGVGFEVHGAVEYNPYGKMRVAGNLGYRYRPGTMEIERFTLGDAIVLAAATSIPFFNEDLDLLVEAHGEITVDADNEALVSEERPFEGEVGIRYRLFNEPGLTDDLAITGAMGMGTGGPGSPSFRAIIGLNYHWVAGGSWAEKWDYGGYLSSIEDCPDPETTPIEQVPEICRTPKPIDSDGDGIPDAEDNCPFKGVKGAVDERGCPNTDMDGDGILDADDACPEVPEDKDGFQDRDGCPDLDNDGDGIADLADKCPMEPEVINGIDDRDGCPDDDPNAKVRVAGGKVEIREQVFFETGKAKIKGESYDLLDQVAGLLKNNPHIGNIEIEGHTDDRGKDEYNKELSQKRAEAVREHLIKKGVSPDRLTAIGYGEERPIDDNETSEGRARNRRVEFTIRGVANDKNKKDGTQGK